MEIYSLFFWDCAHWVIFRWFGSFSSHFEGFHLAILGPISNILWFFSTFWPLSNHFLTFFNFSSSQKFAPKWAKLMQNNPDCCVYVKVQKGSTEFKKGPKRVLEMSREVQNVKKIRKGSMQSRKGPKSF